VETIVSLDELISDEEGNTPSIDDYRFDPDEKRLLIATDTESIYRYSSRSAFYIYDLENGDIMPLSIAGKQRLPRFSPDGSKVAFVRDNNIFLMSPETRIETQITHDGKKNYVINGTTDWVYEEEFQFTLGYQWSPDSRKIAFFRFDEEHVKEFNMMMYGELYPTEYRFKYPKAGEDNAHVSIFVYDLENQATIPVDSQVDADHYIPRMKWTHDPDKFMLYRLNRHQNHLEMLLADAETGKTEVVYDEKNEYYISINDDLTFLSDTASFLFTSEKDGYRHIYLYDMNQRESAAVTAGDWDVNGFLGVDEANDLVYFTSHEVSPLENHLYSINIDGRNKEQLTSAKGYHNPVFSSNFKYFINSHTTINTPAVYSVHESDGSLVQTLEKNEELQEKTKEYHYSEADFITIPAEGDLDLNAWMVKPPDFDPSREYPVLMYVYGGPGSQTVTHRWNAYNGAWFQMLAQNGYIVVSVDNRGTGARGEAFKKMTYLELGKYETIDQIDAAKYLGDLDYIDSERIGIFGWSYGGYLSSLCLALGADVFSAAIAVAPVTSWRFYDTIYTERYMRTPQENSDGYDDNSPISHVDKIRGAYLLVHGTADDNVHYQNTIEMASALIDADVDFDLMIYPDLNHSITGGNARLHLYRVMTQFLDQNL